MINDYDLDIVVIQGKQYIYYNGMFIPVLDENGESVIDKELNS